MNLNIKVSELRIKEELDLIANKFNLAVTPRVADVQISECADHWLLTVAISDFPKFWRLSLDNFPQMQEDLREPCIEAFQAIKPKNLYFYGV